MSESLEHSDRGEGYEEVQFGPKSLFIPTDWTVERFGDVFNRRKESIDADNDETVRYIGLKHLDSGKLNINGYDEDGDERSSSRAFRKGDVLFGKLRPNLNKAAIAPFDGVCSSDIIPIYAEDDVLQQYLPYLMHSKLVRDRVISTMEGTNLPRTSWNDLKTTRVPLPPSPEQRRIADILSTTHEQIRQTDKIIEFLTQARMGVLDDIILKGRGRENCTSVNLGPKSVVKPEGWEVKTIGDVADVTVGHVSGISEYYSDSGEVPVLSTKNISESGIDLTDVNYVRKEFDEDNPGSRASSGDIIMARHGDGGTCAQIPEGMGSIQCLNVVIIKPRDINPDMLKYQMNLAETRKRLMAMAGGSVQSVVNTGTIRSFRILVPTTEDQSRIADIGGKIGDLLDIEERKKSELMGLRRGLMQDLLTGKVRVSAEN